MGRNGAALERQAHERECEFAFREAYQYFLQAAESFDEERETRRAGDARFRAALSLERAQEWRSQTALWENIGDRIGRELMPPFATRELDGTGQSAMFHLMSVEQWAQIEGPRARQAFAYLWAARGAEEAGITVTANRLYLKAGLARELSARETKSAEEWRLAAHSYFLAAYYAARSIHPEDRDWERVLEAKLLHPNWHHGDSEALWPRSDLDRLRDAWAAYGTLAGCEEDARTELCEHLKAIQTAYDGVGRRRQAIATHRYRERVLIEPPFPSAIRRIAREWRRANFGLTRAGSSFWRTLGVAGALYVLAFPLIYWLTGLGEHSSTHSQLGFGEAIIFSLANLVAVSVRDFAAANTAGATLQTAQAISSYFLLGYLVWVVFRSFRD